MPNLTREQKRLGNFNSVGAKEIVIQQETDGTIIGGARKEPPVYPPSPTTAESSLKRKAKVITPTKPRKMMKRVARGKGQKPGNGDDVILFTESAGPDGNILILTATKRDKSSVFLKPILDAIEKPNSDSGRTLVDPNTFDCRLANPKSLWLRKSREDNEAIPIVNKPNLFQIGIVAYTNKDNHDAELSVDPNHLEKLFKTNCEKILKEHNMKQSNRRKPTEFLAWKPSHSLSKPGSRPLDHVLVDKAVGHVLGICFVDEDTGNTNDVYNMLKECAMDNSFFSRHPKTNRYCDIAISEFGYPKL